MKLEAFVRPLRYHVIGDSHGIGVSQQGGLVEALASILAALGLPALSVGTLTLNGSVSNAAIDNFDALAGVAGLRHDCVGGVTTQQVLDGSASPSKASLANVLASTGPADFYILSVGSNDPNTDQNTSLYTRLLETVAGFAPSSKIVIVGPGTSLGSTWAFVQPDTGRLANIARISSAALSLPYDTRVTSFYSSYSVYNTSERGTTTDNTSVAGFIDTAHFRRGFYRLAAVEAVAFLLSTTASSVRAQLATCASFGETVSFASSILSVSAVRTVIQSGSDGRMLVDDVSVTNNSANSVVVTLEEEARDISGNALTVPVKNYLATLTVAPGASASAAIPEPWRLPLGASLVATPVGTSVNVVVSARTRHRWIGASP